MSALFDGKFPADAI